MYCLSSLKTCCLASFVLFAGIVCLPHTNGANILGVFTSHSPSHFIVHMSLMKSLAEGGHNITVVSSQQPKVTHPSIRHVVIPPTEEQEKALNEGMNKIAAGQKSFISMILHLFSSMFVMIEMQCDALKDARFTQLYSEKYDLVFMGFFLNDYQLGVAAKFKAPVIVSWTAPPMSFVNDFVGNPNEVAYVPNLMVAIEPGMQMNFWKRLENFFKTCVHCVFKFIFNQYLEKFYADLFGNEADFPTLDDMRKNVSLLFCNGHFSEGPIRPNVPAVIEIGGIQIKQKPDILPKDIADFLDGAKKDGAILFCLGSNLKGTNIKPEIVQTIFKTLSNLKQKVIWKWDDLNNLPGKSANILYKQWIPQDDILAHPNLKLFITHAGKGGIAEAQYHAVPMVALPIFAEQPGNAEKMALSGYGLYLDIFSMTSESFEEAIAEVITNPKYKANIQRFSDLYRDRPMAVKQSVVFWTEYVLRHHGAKHMQSPLVHLNFFQSSSLDVISFLAVAVFIIFKIMKMIFRLICKQCCSRNKKVKEN